jgi:hypothetical protein
MRYSDQNGHERFNGCNNEHLETPMYDKAGTPWNELWKTFTLPFQKRKKNCPKNSNFRFNSFNSAFKIVVLKLCVQVETFKKIASVLCV